MSKSINLIAETAKKTQLLACEFRSNGVLNDSYLNDIEKLQLDIKEQTFPEVTDNPQVWKTNCEELLKALLSSSSSLNNTIQVTRA